jgi:pimeloyl-ACP methyl ester carboxylesterase
MTGDSSAAGISEGTIEANGLSFGYLAAGDEGPLALCLHGFPDSAWTWRHLLPRLADAGYRAVAPWLRGYAPTQVPDDGCYQTGVLAQDAGALHTALGGDDDAVLIGHDWGALASYAAAHDTVDAGDGGPTPRWSRVVTMAVPPPGSIAAGFLSYDQLQRSWYMFFFQHPLAEMAVAMGDLDFIDRLWADWSPGFVADEDRAHAKDALGDPANVAAALGYYRATLSNVGLSSDPEVTSLQEKSNGPVPVPCLYLHGNDDGCMGAEVASTAGTFLAGEGSRVEFVDGAGHFLHLEKPELVNGLVLDFLKG